ncbi:hypothetical protein KIN20_011600 [Parelaphostrongylus tenuis]|uniref:Uncharacterized protein n=1 Tax=Parelaphostrongylus tenuis TaxID=148309 RepID=A0AAD5QM64_PARTN|nr:hypothetical protein KIN20_011600 [Parelaphostrongylus tenuis]
MVAQRPRKMAMVENQAQNVVRYKDKSYPKNPRGRSNQDETKSSTLSQSVQDDSTITETKIVVHRPNQNSGALAERRHDQYKANNLNLGRAKVYIVSLQDELHQAKIDIETQMNAVQIALDNYNIAADRLDSKTPLLEQIQTRVEAYTEKAIDPIDRARVHRTKLLKVLDKLERTTKTHTDAIIGPLSNLCNHIVKCQLQPYLLYQSQNSAGKLGNGTHSGEHLSTPCTHDL